MTSRPPIHEFAPAFAGALDDALKTKGQRCDMPAVHVAAASSSMAQETQLRMSYGLDCHLARWYEVHAPTTPEHAPTTLLKFAVGHVVEGIVGEVMDVALGRVSADLGHSFTEPKWWRQMTMLHPRARDLDGHPIVGHVDGALFCDGEPYLIYDVKATPQWAWAKWEEGRLPDPKWGYRHQAGNYLVAARDRGYHFDGFLWIVGAMRNLTIASVGCGYAYADELMPYAEDAEQAYSEAVRDERPSPCCPGRDSTPCRSGKTIYCAFYTQCCRDAGIVPVTDDSPDPMTQPTHRQTS